MKIEMKGINKSFGQNQVLKDAGFVLDDGEVHALMGENGAGKSTLMKILTGVYTRDGGTVIVDGKEVTYKSPQEAERAGIVFIQQELNVLFDLTVEENLFLGKEIKKGFGICDRKAMRAKAEETLKRLGVSIPTDKVMSELSVGQQQMIEICKALMVDAKVIIMDEPTLGIDPEGMRELMTLIRSLAEDDKRTILISSHQLYQIQQICDRVGLFVDGRLIACGRIDELAGQMRREGHYALEAAAFPDDSGFEELLRSLGNVEQVERTGDFYVVHSRSDLCRELNRRALEKGYTLRHLRQRGNDLDEIYRRYFEKGEQKNGGLNQKKNKGFLSFGREQR